MGKPEKADPNLPAESIDCDGFLEKRPNELSLLLH
jgi:hypothetical protein